MEGDIHTIKFQGDEQQQALNIEPNGYLADFTQRSFQESRGMDRQNTAKASNGHDLSRLQSPEIIVFLVCISQQQQQWISGRMGCGA